jgi:hypothetical protein
VDRGRIRECLTAGPKASCRLIPHEHHGTLDVHRRQLAFDYLDTASAKVRWGRVVPSDPAASAGVAAGCRPPGAGETQLNLAPFSWWATPGFPGCLAEKRSLGGRVLRPDRLGDAVRGVGWRSLGHAVALGHADELRSLGVADYLSGNAGQLKDR